MLPNVIKILALFGLFAYNGGRFILLALKQSSRDRYSAQMKGPSEGRETMKAKIIQDQCIGDGICADTCPEVFEMRDDGLAYVITDTVPADAEATAKEAAEACPTEAIEISE